MIENISLNLFIYIGKYFPKLWGDSFLEYVVKRGEHYVTTRPLSRIIEDWRLTDSKSSIWRIPKNN